MVSTPITTTPAATRRADTSFTGFGNEKKERARLGVVTTPLFMTCSFSRSG